MSNPPRDNYELVDTDVSLVVSFGGEHEDEPSPGEVVVNAKTDAAGFIVDGTGGFQYLNEFNEVVSPPVLPSGHVIDAKNTLQSFASDPLRLPSNLEDSKRSAMVDTLGTNTAVTNEATRNSEGTLCIAEAVAIEPNAESTTKPTNAETKHPVAQFLFRPCSAPVWMVLAFMVIVIVAIVTGVLVSQNSSGNTKEVSPENPPIDMKTQNQIVLTEFINNITLLSDKYILANGTSPESQALAWILDDKEFWNDTSFLTISSETNSYVSFRVLQRYALAVLWFQQGDGQGNIIRIWRKATKWLDADECQWYGISCKTMNMGDNVGSQKVVIAIDFNEDEFDDDSTQIDVNYIGGRFPDDLALLTSIQHLDFSENGVAGSIPNSVGKWTSLTYLNLQSNVLTGRLPESIGLCAVLTYIDISYNTLTATLPESVGQLTALTYFDLSNNELTGALPELVTQWTALTSFNANGNSLSGSLPELIGQWTALTYFDANGNSLNGHLPESSGQWTALTYFDAFGNSLNGTLPESIGHWNNLSYFDINGNDLSGSLPESIGQWTALTSFDANGNSLNGTLPKSIVNWTKLQSFNLNMNSLSGALPSLVGQCTDLSHFDLSSNRLSGPLPASIGHLTALYLFSVDSNELTGSLPVTIGNWTGISTAHFGNNFLTGTLPGAIGKWTAIYDFSVSTNRLNGTIPESISNWTSLSYANFTDNSFTGVVPCFTMSGYSAYVEADCTLDCTCCSRYCP
jgi:Leucine-rich repeat (LRR) protein